jgi:MerR family redox-sensitive transcriptional activator SoxR
MRIGEVAKRSRIPASALRYYEEIGLIPAPRRVSGQRDFDPSILRTLTFIRTAQELGFSLREIDHLLRGFGSDASARWSAFAGEKIAEIDALIAQYEKMKKWIARGLACGCIDLESCELLD